MDQSNPQVSIIMATYNRADFLERAIKNVFEQSFENWELIIINDGSSDNTFHIVQKWQQLDQRIRYASNASNQGISKTYNKGFKMAQSKYIAMQDDDDMWSDKEKLDKQIVFLDDNPEYVGCGGGMIVIDCFGNELYRYLTPQTDEQIKKYILFVSPMANSTTLFRKDIAEKVGFYDESIRLAGDKDFWLKMSLQGKLYNFQEYFSYYTIGENNVTLLHMREHVKTSSMVARRYRNHYPFYFWAKKFYMLEYAYSFLPNVIKKIIHTPIAYMRKKVFSWGCSSVG